MYECTEPKRESDAVAVVTETEDNEPDTVSSDDEAEKFGYNQVKETKEDEDSQEE